MTTRKFCTIQLPHPRYSLEVGKFALDSLDRVADDDLCTIPATCLPRLSHKAQFIEISEPGGHSGAANKHASSPPKQVVDFLGSYVIIENARPELFLRRDFIAKFVDRGTIHLAHSSDRQSGYNVKTKNNVLIITMDQHQYRRFGLIAKRVLVDHATNSKFYLIEIDLKDERLKKSNKFLDKMVKLLQRLNVVDKIYFRFVEDKSNRQISIAAANKLSCEYFKHVIEEYAFDGCLPVPLASCSIISQRIERSWLNCSQLHPSLDLSEIINYDDWLLPHGGGTAAAGTAGGGASSGNGDDSNVASDTCASVRNKLDANLTCLVDIVEWLGYQLLLLDCDRYEIQSKYLAAAMDDGGGRRDRLRNLEQAPKNVSVRQGQQEEEEADAKATTSERLNVSCTQIAGPLDFQHVQENLNKLFGGSNAKQSSGRIVLRALILYTSGCCDELPGSNSANGNFYGMSASGRHLVYIQDCARGASAANTITVIGMSTLAN